MNIFTKTSSLLLCITPLLGTTASALPLLVAPSIALATEEAHVKARDLKPFYQQILLTDSQNLQKSCRSLAKDIGSNADTKTRNAHFSQLLENWKAVQNTYVINNFDDGLIDEPRYIDIFHYNDLKRNNTELARALRGKAAPADALFKNAHKTVNALEYVLFADVENLAPARRMAFAGYITNSLCARFDKIHQGYQAQEAAFLQNGDQSLALLMNHLIDGTYALKEWRLGDVIGASKKYAGNPDLKRSEYPLSHNSINAILSILKSHQRLFNQKNGVLLPMVTTQNNGAILKKIDQILTQAIHNASSLKNGFQSDPAQLKALFKNSSDLHKAYYEQLIDSLDIVSSILEADGD